MSGNLDFTVNSIPLTIAVEETNLNITPSDVQLNLLLDNGVNLQVTPEPNNLELTVNPTILNISPSDIQLTIAEGISLVGGNIYELQYNDGAYFGGVPNVTWQNGNLTLTNVANLKIPGGLNGYFLQTDGLGNLNFAVAGGGGGNGSPGGANSQVQYNSNGIFAGNALFTFNEINGNLQVPGNIGTVNGNITGNNLIGNTLTTTGNANVGGTLRANNNIIGSANIFANTGIIQGANVQGTYVFGSNILATAQFNSPLIIVGNLGGSGNCGTFYEPVLFETATGRPPFYVDSSTIVPNLYATTALNANYSAYSNIANTANRVAAANITGNTLSGNVQISNLTQFGTVIQITMAGDIIPDTDGFYNVGTAVRTFGNMWADNFRGGNFVGNGAQLTNLNGANITGSIANANYASYAGNVTLGSQPNITSVGTLTSLAVTGNITSNANITASSNVSGSRLISTVANGTAPLVVTSTTQVGNLNASYLEGYVTAAGTMANTIVLRNANADIQANGFIGNVLTANQPFINELGNLSTITVTGNANVGNLNVSVGGFVGGTNAILQGKLNTSSANQSNITQLGTLTGLIVSNTSGYANILPRDIRIGAATANSTIDINANVVTIQADTGLFVNAIKSECIFVANVSGNIQANLSQNTTMISTGNATGNFTLNLTGATGLTLNNMLKNDESISYRFIFQNDGANTFYPDLVKIDNSNVTPRWSPAATGTSNRLNVIDFNIYKSAANTYTVLARRTDYQ